MSERRAHATRDTWPWWRRRVHAFAEGFHNVFIVPWLDAKGNGSVAAVLAGLTGFGIVYRLVVFSTSPGWPEAWMLFSAFLGVPLYESAMTVARLNPERLLEIVASKLGVGEIGSRTSGADVLIAPRVPDDLQ